MGDKTFQAVRFGAALGGRRLDLLPRWVLREIDLALEIKDALLEDRHPVLEGSRLPFGLMLQFRA